MVFTNPTTTSSAARRNRLIALAAMLFVACIGLVYVISRAATSTVSFETEQGVGSGVAVGTDINASGGKYVQFGSGGGTVPPNSGNGNTGGGTVVEHLDSLRKKEIAMILVSTAENSSMDWRKQYAYIEYNVEGNASENRGYTAGIIGFTSKTHDMLELIKYYDTVAPNNALTKYIPALQKVDGTSSQAGLGTGFTAAWATAAKDPKFIQAQDRERDRVYFIPAVNQAKADGLKALGQFAYYDALVMHGPGASAGSFGGIRATALKKAKTPAQGGDEKTYISAFLDARKAAMLTEAGHSDTTRVDTAQRSFLNAGNLTLALPLSWKVYGDPYNLTEAQLANYLNTGKF